MATTIAIITKGNVLDIEEPSEAPIYQNMVDIADGTITPWGVDYKPLGTTTTVHWTTLAATYAVGWTQDGDYNRRRIAILDVDNMGAQDAIKIAGYVNEFTDTLEV